MVCDITGWTTAFNVTEEPTGACAACRFVSLPTAGPSPRERYRSPIVNGGILQEYAHAGEVEEVWAIYEFESSVRTGLVVDADDVRLFKIGG